MGTQSDILSKWVKSRAAVDFEAVYQAELPRVLNFFRYLIGNEQMAEDLTAETFEKAWRNRERYRQDLASFSTWLFTVARHVAADHFRRRRPTVPLNEAVNLPDPQIVEEVVQERADLAHLARLLSRLEERERELVALKYGAGLTNRAIVRLTGLSESNVSTILYRITKELRAQWESEHE